MNRRKEKTNITMEINVLETRKIEKINEIKNLFFEKKIDKPLEYREKI